MTIQTLFGTEDIMTKKHKPVRFKVVRPIFETLTIRDEISTYFGKTRYTDPEQIFNSFKWLQRESKEWFIAVHLDSKNVIQCIDVVSVGSMNQSIVNVREVFKSALLTSCMAMILIHNHPSQNVEPSREDISITGRLKEAGALLSIPILDHIIIGETYYSFVSNGLM